MHDILFLLAKLVFFMLCGAAVGFLHLEKQRETGSEGRE